MIEVCACEKESVCMRVCVRVCVYLEDEKNNGGKEEGFARLCVDLFCAGKLSTFTVQSLNSIFPAILQCF